MLAPIWTLLAATAVTLPAHAEDSAPAPTSVEAASPPDADASDLLPESPEAELARLLTVHHSHPAECAAALKLFLQTQEDRPAADPHVVQNARLHLSGCLIRAGRPDEASRVMTAALRANATMEPPSHFVFGTDVLELYFRTKEKLRDEARDATTRPDASLPTRERVILERNRRWLASVPFGVGQFQNEDMAPGVHLARGRNGAGGNGNRLHGRAAEQL